MKALIVEDNDLTRVTIKALLEKMGYQVVGEVANGSGAAQAFADLRPDVVFLDIILPGRSGAEILSDIKKINPAAKVVIITAVVQQELEKRLAAEGAAAVIHKPFSYEEFKEAVAKAVK